VNSLKISTLETLTSGHVPVDRPQPTRPDERDGWCFSSE